MRNRVHILHGPSAILILVALFVPFALNAATYTWVGPTGTSQAYSWNVAAHWEDAQKQQGIPGSNDDVIISPSGDVAIHLPGNITVNSLQVGGASNAVMVSFDSYYVLHVKDDLTVWNGSRLIVPSGHSAGVQVGFLKLGGDLILHPGALVDADGTNGIASVLLDDLTNGTNSPYQRIVAPSYSFYTGGSNPATFSSPFPLSWNASNAYALIGANVQLDLVDYCPQDVLLEGDLMLLGRIRCVDRHIDLQTGNVWLGSTGDLQASPTRDAFAYSSSPYVPPAGSVPGQNIYQAPVTNPDETLLASSNFNGTIRKHVASVADSFRFNLGYPLPSTNLNDLLMKWDGASFDAGAFVAARLVNAKHPMNSAQNDFLHKYWILQEYNVSNMSLDVTTRYHTGDVSGSHNAMSAGRWSYTSSSWDLGQPTNVQKMELSVFDNPDLGDFTGGPAIKLPVELTSFMAGSTDGNVLLKWTTATEVDNFGFDVERRSGGSGWTRLDFVMGAGNSSVPLSYRYVDRLDKGAMAADVIYYRLKQTDRDGSYTYSPVVEVRRGTSPQLLLHAAYPNPFNPTTTLSFSLDGRQPVTLTVLNAVGEEVRAYYSDTMLDAGFHAVEFTAENLPSGTYYVVLRGSGAAQHRKIILTK